MWSREEQAFAEDTDGSSTWPPRSYTCSFCRKIFRSAQALGGHMNVHRRDRARLRQGIAIDVDNNNSYPHESSFPFDNPPRELYYVYQPQSADHLYNSNDISSEKSSFVNMFSSSSNPQLRYAGSTPSDPVIVPCNPIGSMPVTATKEDSAKSQPISTFSSSNPAPSTLLSMSTYSYSTTHSSSSCETVQEPISTFSTELAAEVKETRLLFNDEKFKVGTSYENVFGNKRIRCSQSGSSDMEDLDLELRLGERPTTDK
ncbi:hypothetical protein SUGI_0862970 [Cryptomeria japonica]|nr:hypothetical protein SUGI_0862970 [Cryptomeria japonica]